MKIKICGLTRPEDAELVTKMGATHVGCVMVHDSPRCVNADEAKEVFKASGSKTIHVLVFRASAPSTVREMAKAAGTKHVQLHHFNESEAEELEEGGFTVYRVFEVPSGSNVLPPMLPEPARKRPGVLDVAGGTTGITFPWEILGNQAPKATFISGGVRPENVCALLTHKPFGIDISSGLEIEHGVKDPDRIQLLFDTLEAGI